MDVSTNSSATETVVDVSEEFVAETLAGPSLLPELPQPPPPRPRSTPVSEEDRFVTLDVVRGVALCGILLVNMENFAMIREARYDPALGGGDSAFDHFVWYLTYLFADTKFIAIFTMLFGAGIAVASERNRMYRSERFRVSSLRSLLVLPFLAAALVLSFKREENHYFIAYLSGWAFLMVAAPRLERLHYRRMLFLLGVGAAHGMYLWRGDILYFYAFWGLWLYFVPRVPMPVLVIAGLGIYSIFVQDFSHQLLNGSDGYSWWEREIYRGTWHMQYEYRMQSEHFYLMQLPIEFSTHLIGLMLFGMSLFKSGFLPGRWRTWIYFVLSLITLSLGSWLVVNGTALSTGFEDLRHAEEFVWGSLLLSMGYMSTAIALTKALGPRFGLAGFAALGRMAFTNYLMQTIICTTLFYGWGFGLYERTTREQQFGIVVTICLLQMVFSLVWLRIFRIGPLEWIWRSFSYWRVQPILRKAPQPVPVDAPVVFQPQPPAPPVV